MSEYAEIDFDATRMTHVLWLHAKVTKHIKNNNPHRVSDYVILCLKKYPNGCPDEIKDIMKRCKEYLSQFEYQIGENMWRRAFRKANVPYPIK